MTVTALVSGGKDSVYSAYLADTQGRTVDELVVLRPGDPESMLFHTPNLELVALQAEAWGKSCRSVAVEGRDEAAELAALERSVSGSPGWVVAGTIAVLLPVGSSAHGRRTRRPPGLRSPLAKGPGPRGPGGDRGGTRHPTRAPRGRVART